MTVSVDPAFAMGVRHENGHTEIYPGLSKREWFAGIALQGLLAWHPASGLNLEKIAVDAVNVADVLIEQLNKKEGE